MRIKIDVTKTAQQNAEEYYKRSKKLTQKKEGAEKTIKQLEKKLAEIEAARTEVSKAAVIKIQQKEWYEKFHWFFTNDKHLVLAGRDAHQNELLNGRYFEDNDLFFHANIFGAAVVIMKSGVTADKPEREEVAQFAACYSSAWKEGLKTVDVYAMRRAQVSKSTSKGSLGTGSFLLSGEREWYRNTEPALVMIIVEERLIAMPFLSLTRMPESKLHGTRYVKITQGKEKKSDTAKSIAKLLDYNDVDTIMRELPSGNFKIQKL